MKFLLVVVLALLFFTVVSKPACTTACEVSRNCPAPGACPSCFACEDENGKGKRNIQILKATPKDYVEVIYNSMKELDCSFTRASCSCVDVIENSSLEEEAKDNTLEWLEAYCARKNKRTTL